MLHVASVCTPHCMLLDAVTCCCAKFETRQTFQPTTPNISFVPWSPKRSATMLDPFAQLFQHCWGHARLLCMVYKDLWVVSFPRCTAGPNIVGSCWSVCSPLPRRTQQLPTLLAQQCWELLRPFARCLKVNQNSLFMQDSFSMNRNLYFYSSYREICNFSQRCGLGWEQEQEKKMQIKIKFFIGYLWLLSLSTILTLWLFYMRWTHVRHMNATKLRWAKPYTFLNFQFALLFALYDW